jgi:IS5 family transposase
MQQTFSDIEYGKRKKKTKREEFLDMMEEIIPWDEWVAYIIPYYPKGERGRPPRGIEKMLRMFLLQSWFTLSDVGIEDTIYDSYAMRKFMKLNFYDEQVPDATTLLHFRHLLEENKIGEKMFASIRKVLEQNGYMMKGGTIIDATIISAPSSTKNKSGERDPEMHQTKKGNQWYFGMKSHIGVDAGTGYVHSVKATPASEHDINVASLLIREDDEVVYGDSGYVGIEKREEIQNDEHKSRIEYRINRRPGRISKQKDSPGKEWDQYIEKRKSSVRSKVEHPFHVVKNLFGYKKTVYRGISKNLNRLYVLFASTNLVMCARAGRKPLLPAMG